MTHPVPDRAQLLTIEEARQALGIGRSKIYELLMSGELASLKIGSRRLIAVTTIAGYIREQLCAAAAAHPMTRDLVEDLIQTGELRSITLGDSLFVSVDSLDAHARATAGAAS